MIPTGYNPEKYYPNYTKSPVVRGSIWKSGISDKKALFLVNIDNVDHRVFLPTGDEINIGGKKCLYLDAN